MQENKNKKAKWEWLMGIIRESLKERELKYFELTSAQVADAYEGALEDVP